MKTYILIAATALGGVFVVMMLLGNDQEDVAVSDEVGQTDAEDRAVVLPVSFPSNVPMYPGAILDAVQDTDSEAERNVSLTLITEANVPDVITWYRGALSTGGWAVTDDKNVGGYILLKSDNDLVTTFVQSAAGVGSTTVITQRIRIKPTAE